jgi:hypothetical protein
MPNIEIHGLSELNSGKMSGKVAATLLDASFAKKEVVVSAVNDVVLDLTPSDRPYLRIVCTDATEAQQVVDLLKPLKLDIEVLLLNAFFLAT